MVWKPKQQEMDPSSVEALWEKYGTWVTGAVALVLACVLGYMLLGRWQESKTAAGQAQLENIDLADPLAWMNLEKLLLQYGGTNLAPRIQLREGQVMYKKGDYAKAESLFQAVKANASAQPVERAEAALNLAYVAQQRGDLVEARKRYLAVEEEGLYAGEAVRMLALLDKQAREKQAEPVAAPPAK